MTQPRPLAALAAGLALALASLFPAGCGRESGSSGGQPPAATAAAPSGTAAEAAADYIALIKERDGVGAIRKYWNFEQVMDAIFGARLLQHSVAEKAEIKQVLTDFIEMILSHPEISAAMAESTYTAPQEAPGDGDTMIVTFTVTFPEGNRSADNTMIFAPLAGRWQVVDMGNEGQMISTSLHDQFIQSGLTPLEFMRLVGQEVERMMP